MQIISEAQYRDLQEIAPDIFKAGMGAEAIYDIVVETDLEDDGEASCATTSRRRAA